MWLRMVFAMAESSGTPVASAGKPFLADIAPESFNAGHVVLTVALGGATYRIAYVTADDESMKVTGAYDFSSRSGRLLAC